MTLHRLLWAAPLLLLVSSTGCDSSPAESGTGAAQSAPQEQASEPGYRALVANLDRRIAAEVSDHLDRAGRFDRQRLRARAWVEAPQMPAGRNVDGDVERALLTDRKKPGIDRCTHVDLRIASGNSGDREEHQRRAGEAERHGFEIDQTNHRPQAFPAAISFFGGLPGVL